MIDHKKLIQRHGKESQPKKLPFVNLAIILTALIQPIGEVFRIYYLQMIKPIPIILMIYYIHEKNKSKNELVSNLVKYGLIFSLVGDILLMANDTSSFVLGTSFFMVAHVIYIFAFRVGEKVKKLENKFVVMRKVGYAIVFVALLLNEYDLWDKVPSRIVFIPYIAILAFENIVSLERYEKTQNSSFFFVLIGVLLFTISDNLLGFLKFNAIKTDLGRMVIMFTYYGGQYFLMHGALHQSDLVYQTDKAENINKAN